MEYLQRFGLVHDVFPQNAHGDTFFPTPGYARLKRRFDMLGRQPGVGVLVGEVTDVLVPANCVQADGYVDLALAGTMAGSSLDGYHRAEPVARMAYAKPELPPRRLD